MKHFALIGNPNCGKTTLFNSLTGSTAHVGNWPGVTVEKKDGTYKKLEEKVVIVDLPGVYSLSPYTSEEVISRNYILDEKPDCVINVVDVTNLERNLYLTTQLLEIDVPVIIALNMIDELKEKGKEIDVKKFEQVLGVPVVEVSALKQTNLDELMKKGYETCKHKRVGSLIIPNKEIAHLITDIATAFKGIEVQAPIFHAVKLVEKDEIEVKNHPSLLKMVDEFEKTHSDEVFGHDYEAIIADGRYKFISSQFSEFFPNKKKNNEKGELSKSDKIDKVLTHKWLGIPCFLLIMFAIFHLTFAEDFLFLGSLFKDVTPCFEGTTFEGLFYTENGINSPGVILMNLLNGFTDWLTELAQGALSSAPEWVSGLICNGVLGGIFAILSFLPQILCLFLLFQILEDSGYMSRVAFILDRIFKKFGLTGRAFMPMIMGFGCSVPAMINTRTLTEDREKIATIRVIPFFSCGAKLPILTAIAGGIVSKFLPDLSPDLITYGMYLLGITTAIVCIILMRNTFLRGPVAPFVMELPTYRMPQFKSLMFHLWDKAKHFVKKAFTIILASTIIIWIFTHFSWQWNYLPDENINESILASIGMLIQPIFTPLGFGYNSDAMIQFGWVFAVAAITGLIAKENVIATFVTLAMCIAGGALGASAGEDEAIQFIITATGIGIPGLLAFVSFNMLTIPCFAAVATAKAELPEKKFGTTLLFWIVTSMIVSSMVYLVGTAETWWTVFIFAAVFAIAIVGIVLFNKTHPVKKVN